MSEHGHSHDVLNDLRPQHRALRQAIPNVYRGYNELRGSALADGALPGKVKELMAMAIGAILMHGGPATVYWAEGYAAFCEFAEGPVTT